MSQSLSDDANVLLVRTDHLGDMLLTLPMAQVIRRVHPNWRVAVLASPANREAAEHHPGVDEVLVDIEAKRSGLRALPSLVRALADRFDAAVLVHPTLRLALALRLARIPVRVGSAYRAYSFLLNRRLRQHRRGRDVHEAILNLELLAGLGISPPSEVPPLEWEFRQAEECKVEDLLRSFGLLQRPWAVLHPGSSGSALNWDAPNYAALGRKLVQSGRWVVVTGTARESELVGEVCSRIGGGTVNLCGRLSLGELAALVRRAQLLVGGSTGPTHLAALLGTPTVALYAPLRSQRPERWRPIGPRVVTLVPPVGQVCPRCIGERCPHYPCMSRALTVEHVWQAVEKIIAA